MKNRAGVGNEKGSNRDLLLGRKTSRSKENGAHRRAEIVHRSTDVASKGNAMEITLGRKETQEATLLGLTKS